MNNLEIVPHKITDEVQLNQIFLRYFPGGTLRSIFYYELPLEAIDRFESYSRRLVDPFFDSYRPKQFSQLYCININPQEQVFIAEQTKTDMDTNITEDLIYLVEMLDDTKIGHGEIRYRFESEKPYFLNKPFVGFTKTDDGFTEKGYGTRRLHIMNALTQAHYHLPLYSSTLMADQARTIWEKLTFKEKAKRFLEEKLERFQFLDQSTLDL
ncbi:MAG: hypothetical protein KC535_03775, partial [Nanoarchaeota archaeon]|nr:hypothetical protein [Nanoarchaeota archaeon]